MTFLELSRDHLRGALDAKRTLLAYRKPEKCKRDHVQAKAAIELVRTQFLYVPLDENAKRMFPKAVRQLSSGTGFGL